MPSLRPTQRTHPPLHAISPSGADDYALRAAQSYQSLPFVGGGRGQVIALINNKGGVGKTTTTVSLAAALSIQHRVLLIDLGHEASATLSLGCTPPLHGPTLLDAMVRNTSIHRVIRPSGLDGLDYISGHEDLGEAALRLAQQRGPFQRLSQALKPVRDQYAFILIDCPPSFSVLARNALVAADAYIVPVVPQYLALQGLHSLNRGVEQMRRRGDTRAALWGILMTMVDYRTRAARETAQAIRDLYGHQVFDVEIPVNIRLAEAPAAGVPIYQHALQSEGARHYWAFAKAVLARSRKQPAAASPYAPTQMLMR